MIVGMQQCKSLRDVTLDYYGNTQYVPTHLPRNCNAAVIELLRCNQSLHSIDIPLKLRDVDESIQLFDAILQHSSLLVSVVGMQIPIVERALEKPLVAFVQNNRLERLSIRKTN